MTHNQGERGWQSSAPRLGMVRRVYRERPRSTHPGMAAGSGVMSDQDTFERILASLYDAMLNDAHWPATSALIDEACGLQGNALGWRLITNRGQWRRG